MTSLPPSPLTERQAEARRLERRLALLLRVGVIATAVLLALGLPGVMFSKSGPVADGPSIADGLRDLPHITSESLVALGVVVLVATPILQLLTSAVLFWRKRDRLYVALVLTVCTIVAIGALMAKVSH